MLFEDIEDKNKKDQKLSILEKSIILGLAAVAKIVLWKVRRAKTYGDLMKIGYFLENKMDALEEKYPDNLSLKDEANVNIALTEIEEAEKELINI